MSRVLQLSDTHIVPEGELAYGVVDTGEFLSRAVASISALLAGTNAGLALVVAHFHGSERARATHAAAAFLGAYVALAFAGEAVVEAIRRSLPPPSVPALDLVVVQPRFPRAGRWSARVQRTNLAVIASQTRTAIASSETAPDLVVWPETVLTTPLDTDADLAADLVRKVREIGAPVILGGVQASRSGAPTLYRNTAFWVGPDGRIQDRFDKTLAIPVVESSIGFPGRAWIETLMGLRDQPRHVEEGSEQRGLRGTSEVAVGLCFEALFPALIDARRTRHTAAILNLANDSWFASDTPIRQQIAFVSFRAIEQRLWLVRAAHGGMSALIDPFGRVVEQLPYDERASFRAHIEPTAPPSVRERVALLALLAAGGVVGWGICRRVYA